MEKKKGGGGGGGGGGEVKYRGNFQVGTCFWNASEAVCIYKATVWGTLYFLRDYQGRMFSSLLPSVRAGY